MLFNRLAALAEVLLILALGNIVGEAVFGIIVPHAVASGTASDTAVAAYEGLLILLRLGLAGLFGLALLYYRTGVTPRRAGLSRNGQPLGSLVAQGLVLGSFSSFLVALLFAAHRLVPLGEGLAAWWTYADTPINTAFWVYVLGTSVLIPPLTEEIMTRGYFRVRLVESFGVMSGVILTGLVFGLSHTRYLVGDTMLLLFMAIILINSVAWTYLVQKTGSIIPALIAHALSNGVGTLVLFNLWLPFVLMSFVVLLFGKPILATLQEFFQDLRRDQQRHASWQGLAMVLLILAAAMLLLGVAGRQVTLLALGAFCLLVTLANLFRERRQGRDAAAQQGSAKNLQNTV
jgi:membrane protease YdiL (CAAX protease family)